MFELSSSSLRNCSLFIVWLEGERGWEGNSEDFGSVMIKFN